MIARIEGRHFVVDTEAARSAGIPENWIPQIQRLLLNSLPEGARFDSLILKARRAGDHPSDSLELLPYVDDLPARFSVGTSPDVAPDDDPRTYTPFPPGLPENIEIVSHIPASFFDMESDDRINMRPSFSGVQDKFVVRAALDGDRLVLTVPEGTERGNAIIKPAQVTRFPFIARNEWTCMKLAGAAGLTVPQTFLFSNGHQKPEYVDRHLIVERFDMRVVDGRPEKLQVFEFASVMALAPDQKYAATTEDLFRVAGEYLSAGGVADLARAYFFGICIHNNDMHVKNFSMCINPDTREYNLAPVYDMVCIAALEDRFSGRVALTLGGGYNPKSDAVVACLSQFVSIDEMKHIAGSVMQNLNEVTARAYPEDIIGVNNSRKRIRNEITTETLSLTRALERVKGHGVS